MRRKDVTGRKKGEHAKCPKRKREQTLPRNMKAF